MDRRPGLSRAAALAAYLDHSGSARERLRALARVGQIAEAVGLYEELNPQCIEEFGTSPYRAQFLAQWGMALFKGAAGCTGEARLSLCTESLARTRAAIATWETLLRTAHLRSETASTAANETFPTAPDCREALTKCYRGLGRTSRHTAALLLSGPQGVAIDSARSVLASEWARSGQVTPPEVPSHALEALYQPARSLLESATSDLVDFQSRLQALCAPDGTSDSHTVTELARLTAVRQNAQILVELSIVAYRSSVMRTTGQLALLNKSCAYLERAALALRSILWAPPMPVPDAVEAWDACWAQNYVDAALDRLGVGPVERLAAKGAIADVLRNLASRLTDTGRVRRASWLLTHAEGLRDVPDLAISRARAEQDISLWTAIARLERYLASPQGPPLSPARRRETIQLLIRMLQSIRADSAARYWHSELRRLGGTSLESGADATHVTAAEAAPTGSLLDRPLAIRFAERLIRARSLENPQAVVAVLIDVVKPLLAWSGERPGPLWRDAASISILRNATNVVTAWQPPRRNVQSCFLTENPSDWMVERLAAVEYVIRLAIQFSTDYVTGRVDWLWQRLGDVVSRRHAPAGMSDSEAGQNAGAYHLEAIECYVRSAYAAQSTGRWQLAADARLDAARGLLGRATEEGGVTSLHAEALKHIRAASEHLRVGLNEHAIGSDRADAVKLATTGVAHTVGAYLGAAADEEAFRVADLPVGLALESLSDPEVRSSDSGGRDLEEHLLGLEESVLALRAPDAKPLQTIRARLDDLYGERLHERDVRATIGTRRASVRARGGGMEVPQVTSAMVQDVLRALPGRGAAIIQLLHGRRHHAYCLAAKLNAAGDVVYKGWEIDLPTAPLVRLLAQAEGDLAPGVVRRPLGLETIGSYLFGTSSRLGGPSAEEWLAEAKTWVVIPQGLFSRLPVHAVRLPGGQFVIDDHYVSYAPSFKALRRLLISRAPALPQRALLFGGAPPASADAPYDTQLRFAEELRNVCKRLEALGVSGGFPPASNLIKGKTPALVLHIATHGYADDMGRPLAAYVSVAGKAPSLAVLPVSAHSIARGKAEIGLAFVNACHLGSSTPHSSDLYGFGFALMTRSRSAVLASSYLDAQAAHSMAEAFYSCLGEQPGDPLTKVWHDAVARVRFGRDGVSQALWRWAPYSLWGNPLALF